MERIFIATLGTAPAVVTETLWALRKRPQPWSPDRIELITTFAGAKSLCHRLLHPDGPMTSLFGTPAAVPPVRIFVPLGDLASASVRYVSLDWSAQGGQAATPEPLQPGLADVNDETSATCMGDLILHRVHAACHDPGNQLHLSISGGRKTMSAHALFSLGLVGNPQDEASHVLIGEAFDNHPDFWHPDQGGTIPRRPPRGARPDAPPAPPLSPRDAADSLRLFSIAAPRYDAIPRRGKSAAPLPRLSTIIDQMNLASAWVRAPALVLDATANTVTVCDLASAQLDPVDFVWLRLLATAAEERWTSPEDAPGQPAGALSAMRLLLGDHPLERLDRLRRWNDRAIEAGLRAPGEDRWQVRRTHALTGVPDAEGKTGGRNLKTKLQEDWLTPLRVAAARGPGSLAAKAADLAPAVLKEFGSFSDLRDALASAFGLPLATAMLPKGGPRGRKDGDGVSSKTYTLVDAGKGVLTVIGDEP